MAAPLGFELELHRPPRGGDGLGGGLGDGVIQRVGVLVAQALERRGGLDLDARVFEGFDVLLPLTLDHVNRVLLDGARGLEDLRVVLALALEHLVGAVLNLGAGDVEGGARVCRARAEQRHRLFRLGTRRPEEQLVLLAPPIELRRGLLFGLGARGDERLFVLLPLPVELRRAMLVRLGARGGESLLVLLPLPVEFRRALGPPRARAAAVPCSCSWRWRSSSAVRC